MIVIAAISALVGTIMLYQGATLGWDGGSSVTPIAPERATFLLIAGGTMLIAALSARRTPGVAAVELVLAGLATLSVADADHRYLLADAGVALILAAAAMVLAIGFQRGPIDRQSRARNRYRRTPNQVAGERLKRRIAILQAQRRTDRTPRT